MPELSTWKDEMPDVMFFSSTYESAEIPIVNDTLFTKYIGNNGYPLTVVIDRNGIVAMVEYGTSATQREALKQKIKSLIK